MTRMQQAELESAFFRQIKKRCPTFWNRTYEDPTPPTPPAILAVQDAERRQKLEADAKSAISNAVAAFVGQIGQRYKDATLESYQPATESQRMARDAIKAQSEGVCAFSENIVLYGPCGSGKDHLLIGLARKAIEAGKTARWFFGVTLFREMRDAIGADVSEKEIIEKLTRPGILILSDPSQPDDSVTTYQRSLLLEVIDERYRHCKPTWTTMNATNQAEAKQRLGGQIVDRLWTEKSAIFVNGPSYRKTNQ